MSDDAHAQEIVIIKRHGGHEEGHHGGVWKIAFADFMTAMMAFFLVMWLVSANDKTKATVAKYFNPVELVDSTPQPPGLNDSKKSDPSIQRDSHKSSIDAKAKSGKDDDKTNGAGVDTAEKPVTDAASTAAHDEADLTRDPYAVLTEVATQGNKEAPEKTKEPPIVDAQRGTGTQGHKGGEAFRDPFDPSQAPPAPAGPAALAAVPAPELPEQAPPEPPPPPPAVATAARSETPAPVAVAAPAAAEAPPAPADDKPLAAAALRARIAALGKAPDGSAAPNGPRLDVKQTPEGLLVSLTDSADFSMFPVSSARPAPKMLALVEKIGQLLRSQKGTVTVRGYTDSRPFKSDTYDNWRLSAARAQMAHYMLVRAGLNDSRFDRIEGYADRRPKNPKNPEAAENRRIEILLRDPTP